MNKGTAEQEQNGVTMPSIAAGMLLQTPPCRAKIDRVVTALYKKMGRAMPGTIARDIEENRARAEANEGITVKSE